MPNNQANIPAGFLPETGTDPAEDLIGPFYLERLEDRITAGMMVEAKHCNGMDTVHGGVLMTFADFALCAQARFQTTDQHILTVSLSTNFIDSAPVGSWLQSRGEITRRTGNLVFIQGVIHHDERTVLSYGGIGKRIK